LKGGIFLPEMYYNDSSILDTYLDTLETVFEYIIPALFDGASGAGEADAREIAREILAFETEIASFTAKKEDTSGKHALINKSRPRENV
jgi:hypothetical protein